MRLCLFLLLVGLCFAEQAIYFEGFLRPAHALEMTAPRNELRMSGSGSSSNGIRLRSRIEENRAVKKDDVLLVFRNDSGDEFMDRANRMLSSAIAEAERNNLEEKRLLAQKKVEIINLRVAAGKIKLDLQASEVLAAREVQRLKLDLKIAELRSEEAELEMKDLENQANYTAIAGAESVRKVKENIAYLEAQLSRFELRSPIDGYAFFPRHPGYKRPVKAGDYLNSGSICVQVAENRDMEVEFHVPEIFFSELHPGRELSVLVGNTGLVYKARLSSFNPFPMPLAFLRNDSWLPNGQERYFVAKADFVAEAPEPTEGMELKVSF